MDFHRWQRIVQQTLLLIPQHSWVHPFRANGFVCAEFTQTILPHPLRCMHLVHLCGFRIWPRYSLMFLKAGKVFCLFLWVLFVFFIFTLGLLGFEYIFPSHIYCRISWTASDAPNFGFSWHSLTVKRMRIYWQNFCLIKILKNKNKTPGINLVCHVAYHFILKLLE